MRCSTGADANKQRVLTCNVIIPAPIRTSSITLFVAGDDADVNVNDHDDNVCAQSNEQRNWARMAYVTLM